MNEMNDKVLKIGFWVSFTIMCSSLIGWAYSSYTAVDFTYENDLYQKRFDSMDIVAEEIFPVKNQTVVLTNEGYVSAEYDWENNTKLFDGGWVIQVNHSKFGVSRYLFDGWELKEVEYS